MIRGAGHGIKFEAPMYQDKESLLGFASVDDTAIVGGYLRRTEIIIEDIYISIEKAINRWEGVLKYTGGVISLYKSFIYSITFKWDDQDEQSFENPEDHGMELTVKNEFGEKEELKQAHPRKGYETLGVFIYPYGSQIYQ